MLADVVNDLFELAVELEGFGDEAVVGAGHGDRGLDRFFHGVGVWEMGEKMRYQ